jgi:hypothetical protein
LDDFTLNVNGCPTWNKTDDGCCLSNLELQSESILWTIEILENMETIISLSLPGEWILILYINGTQVCTIEDTGIVSGASEVISETYVGADHSVSCENLNFMVSALR